MVNIKEKCKRERQRATGGPWRKEWNRAGKTEESIRKWGMREGFMGEDGRKRIMRKG